MYFLRKLLAKNKGRHLFYLKLKTLNWVPPNPSPPSECVSNPLGPRWEQHALEGEGVEGPNSDDWIESFALCTL
jgi:hypothetical protein